MATGEKPKTRAKKKNDEAQQLTDAPAPETKAKPRKEMRKKEPAKRGKRPSGKPNGRPKGSTVAINADETAALAACIEKWNYLEPSCAALGLCVETVYRWMDQGKQPGAVEPYASFYKAIQKAYGNAEMKATSKIMAGKPGWQAAAWWLERYRLIRERWAVPKEEPRDTSAELVEQMSAFAKAMRDAQ